MQLEAKLLEGTGMIIDQTRVQADLIFETRRAPDIDIPMAEVISTKDAIFDRSSTEADFFHTTTLEYSDSFDAPIHTLGDDQRACLKVMFSGSHNPH